MFQAVLFSAVLTGGLAAGAAPLAVHSATQPQAEADAAAPPPTWIGLRVVRVPAALASHLGLEDAGLMVVNVVKDSPADAAGIERYDVLLRLGDRPVPPTARAFAKIVQAMPAAAPVKLKLIRHGKKTDLEVTLGSRPDDAIEYKYDLNPDVVAEDDVRLGGKMLFKDPEGRWRLEDLDKLPDLPDALFEFMPRRFQGKFWWHDDDEEKEIKISVVENGRRIEIERRTDGTFEVRRSREDAGDEEKEENVQVYENEEQLRKQDPQAYALLRKARAPSPGRGFAFGFEPHAHGRRHADLGDWGEKFEARMKEAQRRARESMDRAIRSIPKRYRDSLGRQAWRHWMDEPGENRQADREHARFTVDPDGRIEARVRGTDGELTMTFKDADDLKQREPKLYKRYEALQKDLDK